MCGIIHSNFYHVKEEKTDITRPLNGGFDDAAVKDGGLEPIKVRISYQNANVPGFLTMRISSSSKPAKVSVCTLSVPYYPAERTKSIVMVTFAGSQF